ncbi:MAG: hypothetical protein M1820_009862 [Bogoriella megaspora]|nr:MAG: hypothetical protein M1820_009862 [Bogoriella megaspora]
MNSPDYKSAAPLIWINGFPGTGKYTIASLLAMLLGEGDNSLINPAEARFPQDHPNYQQERRRRREAAFRNFVHNRGYRTRFIFFTDFQPNNDVGRDTAREYEAAALQAGRRFLPIYLECDIQENIRRLTNPPRGSSETTKLMDPEILTDMRSKCQLFRFDDVEGITSDVTNLSAKDAAGALARDIIRHLQ